MRVGVRVRVGVGVRVRVRARVGVRVLNAHASSVGLAVPRTLRPHHRAGWGW